jgi:hypothetical protein
VKNDHRADVPQTCLAGGGWRDITPSKPAFLYGYPHVERQSTGVHDPLLASAFYLSDGRTNVLFVHADLIWLSKAQVAEARTRIVERTGLIADHIVVSASHTHSGPVTASMLSNAEDPVVPPPSADFLERMFDGMVGAAEIAVRGAEPAEIMITAAECAAIGGNRLDPSGPRITDIPLVAARSTADRSRWLGLMFINPIHPTVLHADSTVVSGDFPAMCRRFLQSRLLGRDCPVLYHLGAAGNQSPRHVVKSHTFAEAIRLGALLGETIECALQAARGRQQLALCCVSTTVDLPSRQLPSVKAATDALRIAQKDFESRRAAQSAPAVIRTAECAVFGAEETLALARAATSDELSRARSNCLPAEIQVIDLGGWSWVTWPGEVFVEFALRIREQHPNANVVTLANGELQGYLVTAEAVKQNCYEAGNAIFASPAAAEKLVDATLALLSKVRPRPDTIRSLEPQGEKS